MWRAKLKDKYTVVCKKCGKELIDPNKKSNQKFFNGKCPHCGYIFKGK